MQKAQFFSRIAKLVFRRMWSIEIFAIFEFPAHHLTVHKVARSKLVGAMISIVYGSPAAGSGNKRAALIGGLGRHLRPIFANWLYQLPTLPLPFPRV
jgi:hypothetical protein